MDLWSRYHLVRTFFSYVQRSVNRRSLDPPGIKHGKGNFPPIYRDFPLHVWLPKGMSNSGKNMTSELSGQFESFTHFAALPVSSYVSWLSLINWYGYGTIPIHTIFRGWTSIYQLFWCSPGVQGFDTLPYIHLNNSMAKTWHVHLREVFLT